MDERLEKYGRAMNAFFRPTHVRISGMYSSVYNNSPMGFSYLPFKSMNPASLAIQLLGSNSVDLGRLDDQLDIYAPEAYILWSHYLNKNKSKSICKDVNVVLPSKRIPPILSKIATWKEEDLANEIKPYYSGLKF